MNKKNVKLRVAWIIPNICLYLLCIAVGVFVMANASGLSEIDRLGTWVVLLLALLSVALIGTLRIVFWIKKGKM
ncbi:MULTISPECIES: hypothetical protein [Paenibacillus]|uniref:Uncharacterized protein n=1 Tax=Paenibacillus naphthalenovorans TaxID=162209 RepID=A0A0U2INR8_9BACL|nr:MULTISPECIES: hypothetical protein [Paenibacillus]ALS25163.1 hypothetical protein IJ22_49010 [Paenibacillus naphthalenovorans]GCL73271.1 hypothetical protein PN4B1_32080 [Paenibacillus naphthalenovorans]SDI33994.1 hypothetical protein SAMN05421868_105144 [Paenibacillus naphthalenovorans]